MFFVATVIVSAAAAQGRRQVLGLDWGAKGGAIVRVDPATLERRGTARVPLAGHTANFRFSPDHRRIVLGRDRPSGIRIVDVAAMRLAGDVALGGGSVELTRWPDPRHIVVVAADGPTVRISTVDPDARRVTATRTLPGMSIRAHADAGAEVALLLGPAGDVGPAELALVGPDGVRLVPLDRIQTGYKPAPVGVEAAAKQNLPGVAVDPAGGRAYVVGADGPVAVVDLASLRVEYRTQPKTVRHRRPATAALGATGPYRRAVWAGNGTLAVAGYDESARRDRAGKVVDEASPSGLRLIDTRAWTSAVADAHGTSVVDGAGLLLAMVDGPFRPRALRAYTAAGRLRYSVDRPRPLSVVRVTGGLLYLWCEGARVAIVDAASGRVLRVTTKRVTVLG